MTPWYKSGAKEATHAAQPSIDVPPKVKVIEWLPEKRGALKSWISITPGRVFPSVCVHLAVESS